jgi:hypothetical protein
MKKQYIFAKTLLAGAIVFSLGSSSVFAEEPTATSTSTSLQDTTTVQGETVASTSIALNQEETSKLLPGDFFYFIKTIVEKIELALTFNDVKQARLLAEFAQERIKEANALMKEGKTDLAVKSLQEAMKNQELAMDTTEVVEAETTVDGALNVNKELSAQFKLNIEALTLALQKVENPKAQEVLAKNIEKSFGKFSKAAEKINEANEKIAEKLAEIEDKLTEGEITEEEANREISKLEEEIDRKKSGISEELTNKLSKIREETAREINKEAEEEAKEQREKAREEAKEQREKAREEAKEQREKAREEAKEQREKSREEAKEQRERAEK